MLSEVFTSLLKDILFTKTEGIQMSPAACSPVKVHNCGESVLGQSDVCLLFIWQLPSYHKEKLSPIMQKTNKKKLPLLPLCVSWRDVGRLMSSWPEVERAMIKSTCTSIYALSHFTGWPGWQVKEQADRFLDRVVASAWLTGPTCLGTGAQLLYVSWLWIKGLNVSAQVNIAALG